MPDSARVTFLKNKIAAGRTLIYMVNNSKGPTEKRLEKTMLVQFCERYPYIKNLGRKHLMLNEIYSRLVRDIVSAYEELNLSEIEKFRFRERLDESLNVEINYLKTIEEPLDKDVNLHLQSFLKDEVPVLETEKSVEKVSPTGGAVAPKVKAKINQEGLLDWTMQRDSVLWETDARTRLAENLKGWAKYPKNQEKNETEIMASVRAEKMQYMQDMLKETGFDSWKSYLEHADKRDEMRSRLIDRADEIRKTLTMIDGTDAESILARQAAFEKAPGNEDRTEFFARMKKNKEGELAEIYRSIQDNFTDEMIISKPEVFNAYAASHKDWLKFKQSDAYAQMKNDLRNLSAESTVNAVPTGEVVTPASGTVTTSDAVRASNTTPAESAPIVENKTTVSGTTTPEEDEEAVKLVAEQSGKSQTSEKTKSMIEVYNDTYKHTGVAKILGDFSRGHTVPVEKSNPDGSTITTMNFKNKKDSKAFFKKFAEQSEGNAFVIKDSSGKEVFKSDGKSFFEMNKKGEWEVLGTFGKFKSASAVDDYLKTTSQGAAPMMVVQKSTGEAVKFEQGTKFKKEGRIFKSWVPDNSVSETKTAQGPGVTMSVEPSTQGNMVSQSSKKGAYDDLSQATRTASDAKAKPAPAAPLSKPNV